MSSKHESRKAALSALTSTIELAEQSLVDGEPVEERLVQAVLGLGSALVLAVLAVAEPHAPARPLQHGGVADELFRWLEDRPADGEAS